MRDIILASQSPRRKELMESVGIPFRVMVSDSEEVFNEAIAIEDAIQEVAIAKAQSIAKQHPESIVIGCDTIVYQNGKILGKPKDQEEAFQMLKSYSNSSHQVISGVAIIANGKIESFASVTEVHFYPLSDEEILAYIEAEQPYDKAGAYGIQEKAKAFVKSIDGDYFTIMGLPIAALYQRLKKFQ
ncbi:septum formation inhibitor Maf [Erysipelotrichaceae bacterium MTC7]|nr:septum formation inhibitor Maf [Erysipelotrichaceae bacterium MTC7]